MKRAGHKKSTSSAVLHHFTESVTKKTRLINEYGLNGTSLMGDVYLFRDLLRDVHLGRYKKISVVTLSDIKDALDYFLEVLDKVNDLGPGGLFDDTEVIHKTREKHKVEIDAYWIWRKENH